MSDLISLSKMQNWFLDETENSVKKIRSELSKRIEQIKEAMEDLEIAAQDFEVGDPVDAETRSSQNIYEKVTEMVEEFQYPDKVTYKTAEDFRKELEKFLERLVTLGKRFVPNLKRKYKTRVFILNRSLQRIQKNYNDFKKFLEDRSSLLKEVDHTSDMIAQIIEKIKERDEIKQEIDSYKSEADYILDKISQLDEDASNLESKTVLGELDDIEKEMNIIGNKLRLELNSFDKPLRKLSSRAQDGKVNLPPALSQLADRLKDETLEAFLEMDDGYQEMKDLMEKLIEAINSEKIKLKRSMSNKTLSSAQEVLDGSIADLHSELLKLKERKEEVEKRVEELGLEDKIKEYQEKQEELQKEEERKERRIRDLKDSLKEINKEIANLAAETQREVKRLTNQDVKINIKE